MACDGKEGPQLTGVALRLPSDLEGGEGGEKYDAEIEGVGEEEAVRGVLQGN
jgi:hypothetical protein